MKFRDLVFRLMECRETMELLSRRQDGRLGLWQGVLLRLHLRFCWCCKRFDRQLKLLRRFLRGTEDQHDFGERTKLSPEARQRMKDELKKLKD